MFGVALLLSPDQVRTTLTIAFTATAADETTCADPALEALRLGNPAARSLPLLAAIANGQPDTICLKLARGALRVGIEPC
jgi:hypothetical protein